MVGGGEGERSRPLGGKGEVGGGLSLAAAAIGVVVSGGAGDSPAESGIKVKKIIFDHGIQSEFPYLPPPLQNLPPFLLQQALAS